MNETITVKRSTQIILCIFGVVPLHVATLHVATLTDYIQHLGFLPYLCTKDAPLHVATLTVKDDDVAFVYDPSNHVNFKASEHGRTFLKSMDTLASMNSTLLMKL